MDQKWKKLLILIPVIVLAVVALVLLPRLGLHEFSPEAIRDWVADKSPYSELVFLALQMTSVIVAPIPSNVMATAGGLLFGFPKGFVITIAAVTLGSLTTFTLAKLLGREAVQRLLATKLDPKYMDLLQRKQDVFLWMAFLFPFFPDDMICILAGLTDISYPKFIAIVLLARPWGLLFASALGGSALSLPGWSIPILAILLAGLFYLGMKYGDRIEETIMNKLKGS
ncbi:MAG: TVP38/TMEM64 family protein [Oscillospiraceae bacterium]|nr:TVP38/TMEM64 family protein [Oscillospiraceae bacterium]